MAKHERAVTEDVWQRVLERVRRLPVERQEAIIDYIDFVVERQEEQDWELSDAEAAAIARHRNGDLSDTVALEDVRAAILEGRPEEI